MLEETQEIEEIIQRVAALDVGKVELTCYMRVPSPRQVRPAGAGGPEHQTMTRWLLVMVDRLRELGVTRVIRSGQAGVELKRRRVASISNPPTASNPPAIPATGPVWDPV